LFSSYVQERESFPRRRGRADGRLDLLRFAISGHDRPLRYRSIHYDPPILPMRILGGVTVVATLVGVFALVLGLLAFNLRLLVNALPLPACLAATFVIRHRAERGATVCGSSGCCGASAPLKCRKGGRFSGTLETWTSLQVASSPSATTPSAFWAVGAWARCGCATTR
jgi:hypothetical protein